MLPFCIRRQLKTWQQRNKMVALPGDQGAKRGVFSNIAYRLLMELAGADVHAKLDLPATETLTAEFHQIAGHLYGRPVLMSAIFEWDEARDASKHVKHGVRFAAASEVFQDDSCIIVDTTRSNENEARTKAIGKIDGLLFTVVYTERDGALRLISARRSNPKEERAYGSSLSA